MQIERGNLGADGLMQFYPRDPGQSDEAKVADERRAQPALAGALHSAALDKMSGRHRHAQALFPDRPGRIH